MASIRVGFFTLLLSVSCRDKDVVAGAMAARGGADGSAATGGAGASGAAGLGGSSGGVAGSIATAGSAGTTAGAGASGGAAQPPMPGPIDVAPVSVEGPTTWKNDRTAAYTIIHDDTCADTMTSHYEVANVELAARGLRAGFGAIAGLCNADPRLAELLGPHAPTTLHVQWAELFALLENGHELVNHTLTHAPDAEATFPQGLEYLAADMTRWTTEIDAARELLTTHLGVAVSYFIFPYDARTDAQVDYLRSQGYVGARAGDRTDGFNEASFVDPFLVDFAVYHTGDDLNATVSTAIAGGGWGLREIHAVRDGDGWQPVPTPDYLAHLDFVKQQVDQGELWMDGPSAVTRYRVAREHCPPPSASGRLLSFPTPSLPCSKHGTALTFVVTTNGAATELVAIQDGAYLETRALGSNRFFVHADPSRGSVDLSGR